MDAINQFVYETLGWGWVPDYAGLIFLVAVALAFILLLTIIIALAVGHVRKKRIKDLKKINDGQSNIIANKEPLKDSGELRNEIRTEMTPILREEYDRNYEEKYGRQIEKLNAASEEKDKRIQELNDKLAQADKDRNNAEFQKTMSELNQTNKELRNELNSIRMENAALRSQVNNQPPTATVVQVTPAAATTQAQPVAVKQERPARAKKQEPVVSTIDEYADDDDDEEEYDNEYADETSDVKVTLKYDRIKMNWVIYRSDTTRAYRRFSTKQEALVVAKDLARRLHAALIVHKRDGKFQKVN